ncbi:hypothetical protein Lal_00026518 [Lupinus albus]|uniref:Cyclin-dependent kinase inhibitor n=1 Tax=Lupinus albus TaxID=3870 RepID=A0A6A5LKZ2_LUPAL|nr:putative cyclin-dependent kinase inhibitor [Lupinus albus]KAF1862006.1 hypothetical protein Lal_00026518 [Lupinus albus]
MRRKDEVRESQQHVLAEMDMAQVSVKTRARASLAIEEANAATSTGSTSKRRKINHTSEKKKKSSTNKSPRNGITVVSPVLVTDEGFSSPTSDNEFPASCCSSNGSVDEERMKVLDLEVESAQVETSTCNYGEEIERREMSLGENFQEEETNSRRSESTAQNMPTQSELDEFFTNAERDIQKRFQNKYNYDIAKDMPLEGRYEWVQLKP